MRRQWSWPARVRTHRLDIEQLLEYMTLGGEGAIAGRQGLQRLWDPAYLPKRDIEDRGALRVRVRPGDVQTRGQSSLGYFALPILHGVRLVGKLDAKADRKAGVFRVNAIHEDIPFDASIGEGVRSEIENLASWLGLDLVGP